MHRKSVNGRFLDRFLYVNELTINRIAQAIDPKSENPPV